MRPIRLLPLVLACVALGCVTPPGRPIAPGASASSAPRAVGSGSAKPAAVASAAPAVYLRPPTAAHATLAGQVVVDGGYALARAGAARLADAGGGLRVGLDGATQAGGELRVNGRTVAGAGGMVVVPTSGGKQGSSLIGNDGSTLIGNDGSTLIGNDGSTLIGNDGSTLIGNDGSTLIGNDGSTLIGNDGSTYHLAQADAVAPGAPAAACGMWLSVVDLRTGFTLPLGEDADGAPVYTVYTDATGGYKVHVPLEAAPFVRVVARLPGRTDERMTLQALADARTGTQRVDDDEAAVIGFMRETLAGRMRGVMDYTPEQVLENMTRKKDENRAMPGQELFAEIALPVLRRIQDASRAAGIPDGRSPAGTAMSYLLADRVIAALEPAGMTLVRGKDPIHTEGEEPLEGQPILGSLRTFARHAREAAQGRFASEGAGAEAWFLGRPWLIDANLRASSPAQRWRIERPADVSAFVVREHLSQNHRADSAKVFDVMADLGMTARDRDIVALAGDTFAVAFVAELFAGLGEEDALSNQLEALIRSEGPKLVAAAEAPPPDPRPVPPVPVAPALEPKNVTTLALGAGAPAAPWGLALDERGPVKRLYVADYTGCVIRRIDLTDPPTSTVVAGAIGVKGTADGPGADARFLGPADLALDAEGRLIVGDEVAGMVRRLTFAADGGATVETLAGGNGGGTWGNVPKAGAFKPGSDAAGVDARLGQVSGVAVDAQGDVWFADSLFHFVRRIRMGTPERRVENMIGTGVGDRLDGPLATAGFLRPADLVFEPDGTAIVLSSTNGIVRRVPAPITAASKATLIAGGFLNLERPADGYWASAWFAEARAIARDARGRWVVTDRSTHRVRLVHPDGWVSTLAGNGKPGAADGTGEAAQLSSPYGVAIGADGTIYVADQGNGAIRVLK